ncbi:MAG: two-component regulator propeller domain-containing protein [Bacteroidota bacterium]
MQLYPGFQLFYLILSASIAYGCHGYNQDSIAEEIPSAEEPRPKQADPINFAQGVYCGLLDHEGVLWFGSLGGGLYRYDGEQFTQFTEEHGLCDDQVASITEDKHGNLLLGTSKGICHYDRKQFITIAIPQSDTSGLWLDKVYPVVNPNQVMAIVEDGEDALWIATDGAGAYYYDGEQYTQHLLNEGREQEDGLHHNIIQDLLKDEEGNIWFPSMIHGGVSRYDGEQFRRFMPEDGLVYDMVRTLMQDRSGNIYFGTLHHGFSRYDGTSFRNFTEADGLLNNNIRCIFEDQEGRIWLGSGIGETSIFDGETFTAFTDQNGQGIDQILFILEDVNHHLWLGGRHGLWKFDGEEVLDMTEATNWGVASKPSLAAYEYPHSSIDTSIRLSFTSGIRSILEDRHGNIWFGSHQEGVARFDGEQMTYYTVADGLSNNQVRSIYEDVNGHVWFECGQGLSSFDGESLTTHRWKNYLAKQNWQSGAGDLWLKGDEATGYNDLEGEPGVYRYDGHVLSFHTFPFPSEPGDESYYSISTPFARAKDGMVWMGTYGAVIGYDGQNFTLLDNEQLGLDETTGYLHVRSIYEDSQGTLWIGNNGIGALRYDGDTTIHFSAQQGLTTNSPTPIGGARSAAGTLEHIFAIGEDGEGNIWFGDRDTGAWVYDGEMMTNYGLEDGLTTTHIWQIYSARNGELWFAMGDGSVCRFNGAGFDRIF